MRTLIVLTALAVTMAGTSTAQSATTAAQLRPAIDALIDSTRQKQALMGVSLTKTNRSYRREKSIDYILWVRQHWRRISRETLRAYQRPPHLGAFLCIHGYEGSWTDGGSPYWGGLQMDLGFQQTYGRWLFRHKGTADNWTMLEQIWTAEKALKSRGFWPWPNTARYCGLI